MRESEEQLDEFWDDSTETDVDDDFWNDRGDYPLVPTETDSIYEEFMSDSIMINQSPATKITVKILVDCDPDGIEIMLCYNIGSKVSLSNCS